MKNLQQWYRDINGIYLDRNFYRSLESVFAHLVEVSRGLSVAATVRRKRDLKPQEFLPKALAWWFALCGRAGIPDVENMLWAKFPAVCPYCRLPRHEGAQCKESIPAKKEIDWVELKRLGGAQSQYRKDKLRSLAGWQGMFQQIYPRSDDTDHSMNVNRLSEEIGELAEAVRTISVAPQSFYTEAPDVFGWLMGFANQFDFDTRNMDEIGMALERALEAEYPGMCKLCRRIVCKCAPVPQETLWRIAHEAPVDVMENGRLFSFQESITLFRRADEELVIGTAKVTASPDEVARIRTDVGTILARLDELKILNQSSLLQLAASLGRLDALVQQGDLLLTT